MVCTHSNFRVSQIFTMPEISAVMTCGEPCLQCKKLMSCRCGKVKSCIFQGLKSRACNAHAYGPASNPALITNLEWSQYPRRSTPC